MHKAIFVIIGFVFFFSCKAQKKNVATNELAALIQTKGDSLFKSEKLPGLFVGVLNKGQRQYFNFGYGVPDEKRPFDSSMLFEAGSITKTFTAYILESVLMEKGINDSSSIISYLPDSVQQNKFLSPTTFYSLLNHTSGLPRLPENMDQKNASTAPYDDYTEKDFFAYLKTVKPTADGKSSYSNLGAGLAGVLAQKISGKNFATLLHEYIFVPFEMRITTEKFTGVKAQGYLNTQKTPYWNMNVLSPAGGLQCTAAEMLTYLQYMSKPKSQTHKTIIENILQPTATLSPVVRIGKAWHTLEAKNKPVVYWHNGGTYGFSTFAAFIKNSEQAVIVVVNRFNANAVSDALGIAIMRKMLGGQK